MLVTNGRMHAGLAAALVALAVASVGCEDAPAAAAAAVSAPPAASPRPAPALRPPLGVAVLVDTRLRGDIRDETLRQVADMLLGHVSPGLGGLEIVARRLDKQSRDPLAGLFECQVPSVSWAPVEPRVADFVAAIPDELGARKKAVEAFQRAVVSYDAEVEGHRGQLRAAQGRATACAGALRAIDLPPAEESSYWGGIAVAAKRLNQVKGDRLLLLVGDGEERPDLGLKEPEWVNDPALLAGTRVAFVGFACANARRCEQRMGEWRWWLSRAGAPDVQFRLPGQRLDDLLPPASLARTGGP